MAGKLKNGWKGRDVISSLDFTRESFELLFNASEEFAEGARARARARSDLLRGKVVATAFFEPSTRTRLSFSSAAAKLGASVIDLSTEVSSLAKGESFSDTLAMPDSYSDIIVLRHPSEGAALYASEICKHPVVNAGDGSQHHPTQAMLDLFTILRLKGRVDGLNYLFVGDLRYSRTVSSLLFALTRYKPGRVTLTSPPALGLKPETRSVLVRYGMSVREEQNIERSVESADVIYVTRLQKERIPDQVEYQKLKGSYRLTEGLLEATKADCIVMHPLPRTEELPTSLDASPKAAYMRQAGFGVPVRMALLSLILGVA